MRRHETYQKVLKLGLVLMLLVVVGSSFTVALSAPLDGEWVQKADTPFTGGYGEAVVGAEDHIYIAKCYRIDYDPYFARYNPSTDTWASMSVQGLPDGAFRNGLSLEWDRGNYIYALFGARNLKDDDDRSLFYRYNILADSWEQLNNTPHAQGAGNALTWSKYDGCFYAFVGNSKRGTEFIRYNPSTDTWENLTFNPSWTATDDGASLVTIGDDIYALKGEVDDTIPNGNFAKYDIPTDTWIDLPAMPETEGVGDGASLLYIDDWLGYNDTIFALGGGEADEDPGYNFYSYSLSQNQWDELEDIPCPIGYYVGNRLGFADGHIYYWQGTPSTWECKGTAFWMYEMSLPSTLKVHNINTGEDFATIQAAIDDPDTQEGDIIEVEDGTFVENVDVYKSLTISSENGSDTCIVQAANSDDHVFEVTADYVNITGFSITNSTVAISLEGVTHCNITDNNVSDNSRGIGLMFSDNNNIADNIVVSNSVGFLGSYSNNNTIEGNIVTNNYCGIYMVSSSNNFVYNNYFNNTDNALDFGGNIWDIPKTAGTNIIGGPYLGGNYWSDYAGEDLDGDGLGDTLLPYNSSGDIGGGDDRPLVIPEDPCEIYDTNGTPGIQKEEAVAAVSDYLIDHTIDKATAVAVLSCYYFG